MHNNIMAAGSKDRPPMLGPGRYSHQGSLGSKDVEVAGLGTVGSPVVSKMDTVLLTQGIWPLCRNEEAKGMDTDEEIDEQELEAHYSYMAKIQEVSPEETSSTSQPLEQKDISNVIPDSSNICTNDNQVDQNAAECVDERAALANLIANLTLDTEENKMSIQTFTFSTPKCATYNGRSTFANPKFLKKAQSESSLDEIPYDTSDTVNDFAPTGKRIKECECLALKLSKQTESVNNEVHNKLLKSFAKLEKHSISLELSLQHCKEQMKNNPVCKENASNVFRKEREQIFMKSHIFESSNADKHMVIMSLKKLILDTTIQKSKSYYKELYENTNQEWKWWIAKRCPSGYTWTQKPLRTKKIWMPKIRKADESTSISPTIDIVSRITNIVQLILFIVDSGCTKHMTGNLKLLCNFVEKFLGTVHFGNDQFAPILGYGDLIQGNVTIKRVYYVEGLNHNLFSVGQFCDADLEVAFRKSTCFVRDLQGNDLLTGSRGSDLHNISSRKTSSFNLQSVSWQKLHQLKHVMEFEDFSHREFASLGTCVVNARCKHRWKKYHSGDCDGNIQDTLGLLFSLIKMKHRRNFNIHIFTSLVAICYILELGKSGHDERKRESMVHVGYSTQLVLKDKRRQIMTTLTPCKDKCCSLQQRKTDSLQQGCMMKLRLFIVDSGCTKHMTGNLKLLCNFVEKFLGLPKLKYVKDQLCSSCEMSKAKRSSFKTKAVPSSKGRLNLLHMDLCGPMRVASINGKKYILAPFLNVQMTFDRNRSSLGLHQMMSVHISSGLVLHQMTSDHNRSELGIQDHNNEPSSSKLVPKVVPLAVKTATSRQELELLFHHHIAMLRTTGK
ncbi:hypothetical protein Tco_1439739 [Tanacetum coccineum]